MLTRSSLIQILREQLPYLTKEYGVKRIGLFGSYGKDKPTETSDIDLVIEFEHPIGFRFIELSEHLEDLLGKPVDVLTPAGIDGIRVKQVAEAITDNIIYV